MRILSTDLALASTGWWQRQQRVQPDQLHPALAESELAVFPARFPRRLAFSPQLYSAAKEVMAECDVAHIHNLWQYPQYAGHRAAIEGQVPYIVSLHGALSPYLRQHGRLRKGLSMLLWQRTMFDRATMIHVTTQAEADQSADVARGVPRTIVPCGLYVEDFQRLPPREQFRDSHLDGYEGPVILFLSRLAYTKGLDVLVRAFTRTRSELECRLVIAGPDDEGLTPSLQRIAAQLGVGDDVLFVGPLYGDQRLAALASADVWTLCSHTDSFGIAIVEALAAGRAVVVSRTINLAQEIAASGAAVVADADAHIFGEAILEVLTNDRRRAELQARAPSFAARYDWAVVAPQLVQMYRAAAQSGP
jgi:glycosyltransferase involved in cell wall biosynthesis